MWTINYNRLFKLFILAIILLSPFYYAVLAGDQIKSNVFLVGSGSQTSSVNSAIDLPVTLYIGNSLTGVTNPIKKAFFRVSGVYTGGGSLQFKINGNTGTTKTFTLPSVSQPADFEFIYNDDSAFINPASAGSYDYILNVLPTGVTVSGLAAKLEITYQFAPDACIDGASSNPKVKTTEFFVGQQNNSISGIVTMPVSLYIGDDLSGIASPVKSVYFVVSGVYTGGSGSLFLDTDPLGPVKDYYFSSVSAPTNFNLIYRDDSGLINPASAGTYNYNLDVRPFGITVSNLSVKAVLTHQYKPVSCGAGYPIYGDLISVVYDSTVSQPPTNLNGSAYNSIMWKGQLGGASFDQGKVRFQVAAADSVSGPWNYIGGSNCDLNDWYEAAPNTPIELGCNSATYSFNNKRYFRYKIRLCSNDCVVSGTATPRVDDVVINFSP